MLKHLDLFAGIGGFTLAAKQVGGITTTQFVEIDPDAQCVLRSHYPNIPIHPDIQDFKPAGTGGLYTIGFPCTGTSGAGTRTGLNHEESGLWFEALRVIDGGRPEFIIVENPEGLISTGLRAILGGLRMVGYSWEDPQLLSAKWFGAPHRRNRVFIIAYPDHQQRHIPQSWAEQMREMVQRQRAITKFPVFKPSADGAVIGFPAGLDKVPVGVERGYRGRITSRVLFGRTVIPAQAAIALGCN